MISDEDIDQNGQHKNGDAAMNDAIEDDLAEYNLDNYDDEVNNDIEQGCFFLLSTKYLIVYF